MISRVVLCVLVFVLACSTPAKKVASPEGYDLTEPETFHLPNSLTEISGLTFLNGNPDTIYAEQDEEGKLYYLHPGDKSANHSRFARKGDYEDLTISDSRLFVLRSDGLLVGFPMSELGNKEIEHVQEWKDLVPPGEYEGLATDASNGQLMVLCKHCDEEKSSQLVPVYPLLIDTAGNLVATGRNTIDVNAIEALAGKKKIRFNPSALAQQPGTGRWFILSAVNQLLVVTDQSWKPIEVCPLDPAVFNQPEGIAFDRDRNLYISNEGGTLSTGNVLRFRYQPGP